MTHTMRRGAMWGLLLAACGGSDGGGETASGGEVPFGGAGGEVERDGGPTGGGPSGGSPTGGATGGSAGGETPSGGSGGAPGCTCTGAQTCEAGQCVEPAACTENQDCLSPRVCSGGVCSDLCRDDMDCTDGRTCDPGTRECVEYGPCAGDEECADGDVCEGNRCAPRCAEGSCPGAQVCNAANGRCEEPARCGGDADCEAGRVCRDGACESLCEENAQCTGAQSCDLATGQCVEPEVCAASLDCLGDRVCAGSTCADPCSRTPCAGGLACDAGSGLCLEASPCADDDGCRTGRRCVDAACQDPCVENAECPGAQRCEDGACVAPEVCARDLDCPGGGLCVDEACQAPCPAAPCAGGLVCVRDAGRCEEASPCGDDAGCFPGRACVDGLCTAPCVENAECPGAQVCLEGRCNDAAVCLQDADCAAGRICDAGTCADACGANLPCRGTQVCEAGRCAEGPNCVADRDCLGGRRCHPDAFVCVTPCNEGLCADGRVCDAAGLCGEPERCVADADCLAERTCRAGRCRAVSCERDAECGAGTRCVDYACVAFDRCECAAGTQCGPAEVCVQAGPCGPATCPASLQCAEDGLCLGCAANGDCGPGEACVAGACARDCNAMACPAGSVCLFDGLCHLDPAACADDGFAPNEGPLSAALLDSGVHQALVACDGRDDWYRVGARVGVRVRVTFNADAVPPSVRLYPAAGPYDLPVDIGRAVPGESWVAAPAGDWVVEVQASPGAHLAYTLDVEDGVACADDPFDRPWRNDVQNRARIVGFGRHAATLCGVDEDWFDVVVDGRVRLEVEGNVNAEVDGRALPLEVVDGSLVRVRSAGADTRYTLVATSLGAVGNACANAPRLQANVDTPASTEGAAHLVDVDCRLAGARQRLFAFTAPAAGRLRVVLTEQQPGAGLVLLSSCAEAPLACSAATGDVEADVGAGTTYVLVDGNYAGEVRATLTLPPDECRLAPLLVEGVDAPVDVGDAPPVPGGGCADVERGVSVHRLRLDARALVRFQGSAGVDRIIVRGACLDADGEQCADSSASEAVLDAGDYVVLVQALGASTVRYTVAAPPEGPEFADACDGDALTLNRGETWIVPGSTGPTINHLDASVCAGFQRGGNDVVLRFRLAAPARILARLEGAEFRSALYLLDGACAEGLVCPSPLGGDFSAALGAGTHALVVDGAEMGQSGPFTLRLAAE